MINHLAIVGILVVCLSVSKCSDDFKFETKPDWLKTCRFSDPDFVKCSTTSVQGLFDKLATDGINEIETIDPMRINRIKILQGDGPVSVNASLSKVIVTGFSKVKVLLNTVSSKDFSWVTKLHLPKMRLEGNYHMQGRILVIPLNGHGKCFFEPSNMDIVMYTNNTLYEKNGHVFYNVTSTRVTYTITGLKMRLNNLFEGVQILEESTNQYLNENWRPAADALKPIISKTIEDILLDILRKIFHSIPGDYFVADLPKPSAN